jgi:glycosyltransferase involved in cell wall biosynthesis
MPIDAGPRISVCIITGNEEKKIRDCLESVRWADEIVVVDSRSTDATVDICREFTDRIIIRDFPGHIEQKNFAVDAAAHPWILSLDADERVSGALREEIETLRDSGRLEEADGYRLPRLVNYGGRWVRHCGWYPGYKIRLFRRDKGRWGGVNPHDRVACSGTVRTLKGDILHYSFDGVSDHLKTIDFFTGISAGELYKKGKKSGVVSLLFRPVWSFFRMYFLQLGFLDGRTGLTICVLSACHVFVKYAKLRELDEGKTVSDSESPD